MPVLDGSDDAALREAARRLAAGELVAFPTETVYGLGARADDDAAVAAVFSAKGRPQDHPLIVHVGGAAAAERFAAALDARARRLIDAFWPGPLTLIVRRRDGVAAAAAGGQPTIGLRCPSHPVARRLLAECEALGVAGVAAPSANRFGRVSPTRAAHVVHEFGPALTVVDGGACEVGIESAIVDASRDLTVLLRPGMIGRAAIEAALGERLHDPDRGAPKAPGTLKSHYATAATLRLMGSDALRDALEVLAGAPVPQGLAVYSRTIPVGVAGLMQRRMPADAAAAARELFDALRDFDRRGARLIWVEQPPAGPEWDGVRDRLQRAAA